MSLDRHRITLLAVILLAIGCVDRNSSAQVIDRAGIFTSDATGDAKTAIDQMKSRHNDHVLLVETFKEIPADLKGQFESKGKEKFFAAWAEECRRRREVSGVIILICMDPKRVEIVVGNKTLDHLFTLKDRETLQAEVMPLLHEGKFDDALRVSAKFVRDRMDQNEPPPGMAPAVPVTPPAPITPPVPSTTLPVAQATTQPVTQPATEPATMPGTQPTTMPETKPATMPETQPETKPETQPTTMPETKPETKPGT